MRNFILVVGLEMEIKDLLQLFEPLMLEQFSR